MKPRILIVDDEVRMHRLFEINLGPRYQIRTASSGEEALGVAKGQNITLLITDLKMPGLSGLALLREARKILPDLPVIIMTAYGTGEGAVQGVEEGAADY